MASVTFKVLTTVNRKSIKLIYILKGKHVIFNSKNNNNNFNN